MLVEKDGSDLFFRAGSTVRMRLNGQVLSVTDTQVSIDDIEMALQKLLSEEAREAFRKAKDIDFAYYDPALRRRFRISIFMQRNWPSIVCRNIPPVTKTLEELNVPAEILKNLQWSAAALSF